MARPLVIMALVLALGQMAACEYKLDMERHPPPRGTFGEEIHRIVKDDLDRSQPAKGQALADERQRFVRAVDALMPEDMLDSLQAFLVASMPLYDLGIMQNVLRPSACTLTQELSTDTSLQQAIWYLRRTEGYGSDGVLLELIRRLGQRQDAASLLADLAALWLDHDGLDQSFIPSEEDATFAELLSDLSVHLAGQQIEPLDPQSSWAVFRDWLFSEDPRLAQGPTSAQWVVRVDQRGRAMVAIDTQSGAVPAPFVDQDRDGLADLDPVSGDYLGPGGQIVAPAPPFDASGARTTVNGQLIYRYSDLSLSILAALLDQIEPLVEDGILWDLPQTLPAVLGPPAALADDDGVYAGYDPDDSPAVALAHAALVLADYDRLPQLLESILTIAEYHEPQLARLLTEAERVGEVLDRYPDLSTREHNRMLDDLVPPLLEMSRRNYLLRVLETFDDARWYQLESGLAEMLRYRSVVPAGWDYYDGYDTWQHYLSVRQPTDFTASRAVYDNRSNLQRGIHLIYDTDDITHSTEIFSINVPFEIVDMLGFYLDSTAGLAEVPGWAQPFILEFSSTNPTTEEVNRFMIDNHTVLGNPIGREGHEIRQFNGEALMAMEFSGLLDGLRPMWSTLTALDRNLSPSGTRVLAGLMSAVHPHYCCDCNLPFTSSACANVVALEPVLLDVVDNTDMIEAVVDLLASLQGRQTASGYWVLSELDRFVNHLLEPDGNITTHDGLTSVPGGDGLTPVFPISRLYLLLNAMRIIDDAVDADPEAKEAFTRAGDLIYDRFLQVQCAGNGQCSGGGQTCLTADDCPGSESCSCPEWRFRNRRAWILLLDLLDFVRERTQKMRDEGRLSIRLAELDQDVRDGTSGRVLPRVVDAWELIADHPSLPSRFDALTLDLLDSSDVQNLRELRRLGAWAIQHLQVDRVRVPIGRSLGAQLDPLAQGWRSAPGVGCVAIPPEYEDRINLRFLSRVMDLLLRLQAIEVVDENGQIRNVVAELLAKATSFYPGTSAYPLDDLLAILGAVQRSDPGAGGEYLPADMQHILEQAGEFMLDEERGLEILYVMIDRRDGFGED